MKEHFIVSFVGGTSGRFISGLLWNMLSGTTLAIPYTNDNSSHLYDGYINSWDVSTAADIHSVDIYSEFKFLHNQDIGVFYSHTYPNFTHIETHIPNSKIIIVSFTESDIAEIAGNNLFKNQLAALSAYEKSGHIGDQIGLDHFLRLYRRTFSTSYSAGAVGSLSSDDIHKLCNNLHLTMVMAHYNRDFINPRIPELLKDRTLVLPYKDLYTKDENNYVGLTKIAAFANRTPDESVIDSYCRYVDGRNTFLKEKLPWVTP